MSPSRTSTSGASSTRSALSSCRLTGAASPSIRPLLSYAGTRNVDKPGYAGPVVVCNARYVPVAGHRPGRPATKFMEDNRDLSVWLAPVEGTRILMPLRISVRTMMGTLVVEATRWNGDNGGKPTPLPT